MEFLNSSFNILLIIVGFGLLIFVHELGHFLAAKWAGIRTESFAVGMGHVILAWRKGIGVTIGSTYKKVVAKTGKEPIKLTDQELVQHGIGETEYSLRWLPIGGFVKMLGQDDINPNAVSDDPRSYNRCPVGKRMIVVSAGVIMNLILAVVMFIWAFMVGVQFPAPVIGEVLNASPAAEAVAANAESLGVTTIGLQPGDRVIEINGKRANTFADLQIASAMSKPGETLNVTVERDNVSKPLAFSLTPKHSRQSGLLSIGVGSASSATLFPADDNGIIADFLDRAGLREAGVEPGMRILRADGRDIITYQQLQEIVRSSNGNSIETTWSQVDEQGNAVGNLTTASLHVQPSFQILRYPQGETSEIQNHEQGLYGFTPLVTIKSVEEGPNKQILKPGDVILRAESLEAPRMAEFRLLVTKFKSQPMNLTVLRDENVVEVTARVNDEGLLNIAPDWAWNVPLAAHPMRHVRVHDAATGEYTNVPTPASKALSDSKGAKLMRSIENISIHDWNDIRNAIRSATIDAFREGEPATIAMTVGSLVGASPDDRVQLALSAHDVKDLHALSWEAPLSEGLFQSIFTVRTADGNPWQAVTMGFEETYKMIVLTYLTIDRLIRGSVGIEQLRGPVGIVHLGTQIIDKGFMFLVFFLALISVNLAVINFLPIPIVDGGLFLFLIYEKFKGRPPSLAIQNAAALVGWVFIGTALIVVTWNDFVHLFG